MIASIVRTVEPGAQCSHPPGRREVYFLSPYRPCLHSHLTAHDVRLSMRGRTREQAIHDAEQLARTYQNCCAVGGITYSVEIYEDDEDPKRAIN